MANERDMNRLPQRNMSGNVPLGRRGTLMLKHFSGRGIMSLRSRPLHVKAKILYPVLFLLVPAAWTPLTLAAWFLPPLGLAGAVLGVWTSLRLPLWLRDRGVVWLVEIACPLASAYGLTALLAVGRWAYLLLS